MPEIARRDPVVAAARGTSIAVGCLLLLIGGPTYGGATQPIRPAIWLGATSLLTALLLVGATRLLGWRRGSRPIALADAASNALPLAVLVLLRGAASPSEIQGAAFLYVAFLAAKVLLLVRTALANLGEDARSARAATAWLFLLTLPVYACGAALVSAAFWPDGDEPHYLLLTESLVNDGDLDLANDYRDARYAAFYPPRLSDHHTRRTLDGEELPLHDVGLSLLLVPGYALGNRLGALMEIAVAGAALACALLAVSRRLGASVREAFAGAVIFALASPLVTYAAQSYPEIPSGALVLGAVAAFAAHESSGRLLPLAASGAALGLTPWLSARNWVTVAMVGGVLGAATLLQGNRRALRAAVLAGAFALPILGFCVFDLWLYHDARPNAGYFVLMREGHRAFAGPDAHRMMVGTLGLLADRAFGLLPTAPIYLLAIAGLFRVPRGARWPAAALSAAALANLVVIGWNPFWYGGWAPPSRYLVVAVALLAPFGALAISGANRLLLAALAAWSFALALLYTAVPGTRLTYWDVNDGAVSRFLEGLAGVRPGVAFPSFIRAAPQDYAMAAAWLLAAAAAVLVLARRPTPTRSTRP